MDFKWTVVIRQEEEWFVASCLENGIASQGKTLAEATANLKEAIALYYEDEPAERPVCPETGQIYVTTLEMAL